jgi:hypothetical protein
VHTLALEKEKPCDTGTQEGGIFSGGCYALRIHKSTCSSQPTADKLNTRKATDTEADFGFLLNRSQLSKACNDRWDHIFKLRDEP